MQSAKHKDSCGISRLACEIYPVRYSYAYENSDVLTINGEVMNKKALLAAAVAIAVLSTACGGGGGSSPTPALAPIPVPVPTPTPTVPAEDIQKTVPALTYPVDSAEFSFVTALNAFRAQVGLGLLAQNAALDKSAGNHLAYILRNDALLGGTVDMRAFDPATGRSNFHIEDSAKPLFTGVQEIDRAKASGYAGQYVGEEIAFGGGKGSVVGLNSLIAGVYHRAGLMFQGPTDVSVAVGKDASQTLVMDFGYGTKTQRNAADYIGVYPADKQTGVGLHASVEVPNPFPELSLNNDDFPTKTGYPVSVSAAEGVALKVQEFTLSDAGVVVDSRVMHKDNDPNKLLASNVAFLVAKARLKAGTQYQVRFVGTAGSAAVNRTWNFTTANN